MSRDLLMQSGAIERDAGLTRELPGKLEKGRYVFDRLREVAARTQPAVTQAIRDAGLEPVPFYIINRFLVLPRTGETISEAQLATLKLAAALR